MRQIAEGLHGPFAGAAVGRDDEKMCLLAKLLGGFSNSTRLSILLILAHQGETGIGNLVAQLEAPQPRVSDHLRRLSRCGYVKVRREGRNAYYSVADERAVEMIRLGHSLLEDHRERVEDCDDVTESGC